MLVIVADTGPLLRLEQTGLMHLLALAGSVSVPPAVAQEWDNMKPGWRLRWGTLVKVEPLAPNLQAMARSLMRQKHIQLGEAEAIALYGQLQADWLLTEDKEARRAAEELNYAAHGAFGIVLWAARQGHLDEATAKAAVDSLEATGAWYKTKLVKKVRRQLWKIFNHQP